MRENADLTKSHLKSPRVTSHYDEWLPDDVELNTVTINSMSIDGKSVETDGTRGRNREVTVEIPNNGRTLI